MDQLIGLDDAADIAGVSTSTIRNYIKDNKLAVYRRANRYLVERSQVQTVFGTRRVSPPTDGACRVIAVGNQKGGVGKTTTAASLAYLLARETPVLAIDCDPQGNLTQAFGLDPDAQEMTLYNVIVDDRPLLEAAQQVGPPPPDLAVVPANLDLADTWRRIAGRVGLESLLRTAVQPALGRYRFVILDLPPALDLTTINALVAATEVIVPVDMSVFSVRGMVKLMGTLQEVRKVNPNLPAPRILACRTEHTSVSQQIEEELRSRFDGHVFRSAIPRGKDVPAAHAARIPLPRHAPRSKTALAYAALAEEVLNVA